MTRRNLCYHCYPLKDNGVWQWNMDQLRRRWALFTGKKVIAVVTDEGTDTLATVQRHLDCPEVDWLTFPNHKQHGEGITWLPLWERLQHEPGITFRAHAKGVTPFEKVQTIKVKQYASNHFGIESQSEKISSIGTDVLKLENRPKAKRLWADALYRTALDAVQRVEEQLDRFPITGSCKQITPPLRGAFQQLIPPWQYLGTFYWVRNDDFFRRAWRDIVPGYYATEIWPGFHYDIDEAGCLFFPIGGKVRLNDLEYLEREMMPALQRWEEERCTPPRRGS